MIRVLAVDDHPLLRGGIAALIGNQTDMELVAEASNGREALQLFRIHRPDITLMDLQMPDMSDVDAMSSIRGEFPEARIVVLTTHAGDVQVSRALKAGARAYLLKGSLRKELLDTIRAVHAGQKRVSAEVTAEIAERATDDVLTPREVDVLRLVSGGNANKEIAVQLSLTEETVNSHIRNILAKLGAHDRTHAIAIGLKRGIIELWLRRSLERGTAWCLSRASNPSWDSVCNVYFQRFRIAGQASVCFCSGCLLQSLCFASVSLGC